MKKSSILPFLFFFFSIGTNYAQTLQLWGMTSSGGTNNLGTIYKMDLNGTGYTTVYSFSSPTGYNPLGGILVKASGNLYYGLNHDGGANGKGCLFSFDPVATTNAYTDLIDFNGTSGDRPSGNLTLATDGNFYGVTTYGGTNSKGVLFRFNPSTQNYTVLFNFSTANGTYPVCTLIQASDGKLYGTTNDGGATGYGVLFKYDPINLTYTIVYSFTNNQAYHEAFGTLMQANNGLIYGLGGNTNSLLGGSKSYGTNFGFNPTAQNTSLVHKFSYLGSSSVNENHNGYLVQETLFGTLLGLSQKTSLSNGKIYQIDPLNGNTYTELFDFSSILNNGENPIGGLLLLNGSEYFGVTKTGGVSGKGVVFSYISNRNGVFTKLYDFTGGNDGANPIGNLFAIISPCTSAAASPGNIIVSGLNGTAVCPNDTISCSVLSTPATTYSWTAPTGTNISGGQGTNQITLSVSGGFNVAGTLSVVATNACGSSSPATTTITQNQNPPAEPGIPTVSGGVAFVCPGDTRTYTVVVNPNMTYNWIPPTGATILYGQGTNSIIVLFNNSFTTSGTLSVNATNGCGTSTASILTISRNIPATPGTITVSGGSAKVCPGDSRTYTVSATAGITYNWSKPTGCIINSGQGTNTINVTYNNSFTANGNLSVTASNGCGISGARTLAILRNVPAQPGSITEINGSSIAACPGDARVYGVSKVTGLTYTWTLPAHATIVGGQGSSYIYVVFQTGFAGGTLKVNASNGCSTTIDRSLSIPLNLPAKPGAISGTAFFCPGNFVNGAYLITPVANATSYVWASTLGPVIQGQGTTTAVVNLLGSVNGTVTVASSNGCGLSAWRSLTVQVNCRESQNFINSDLSDAIVYPNPTNGLTTLKFTLNENENYDIIITDITGREVMHNQNISISGLNETVIDMSQLAKGIYSMKMKSSSVEIFKRIVKY